MNISFFFYGTLCHPALLEAVLGRMPQTRAARLAGHVAVWAENRPHPMLTAQADGVVEGLLVQGLTEQDRARLDYYEGGFDFAPELTEVDTGDGRVAALVYFTPHSQWEPGAPWSLAAWQQVYGDAITQTAGDVMALFGQKPADQVLARYGQMLVHGASRARAAADPAPATLRRKAEAGDVQVEGRRQPYANFFAVEEYDLRYRRFEGGTSARINRACFVSGDAVTVLPYDPLRDRVLLVEQFRTGPFVRGDRQPWCLEAIAGRIDPAETPEQAARREAIEEAQLTLGDMLPVSRYYPSPGAVAEYLYSYVALTDLPDGVAGVFGVMHEAEDIKGHLISFDQMMALIDSGEIANAPLILSAFWLQRERPHLREKARQSPPSDASGGDI